MSVPLRQGYKISKPLVFALLSGFLLIFAIVVAPSSRALLLQSSDADTVVSTAKGHRPQIVPGQVLVRFRENKAFEGSAYVAVPSESTARVSSESESVAPVAEQIPVQIERLG